MLVPRSSFFESTDRCAGRRGLSNWKLAGMNSETKCLIERVGEADLYCEVWGHGEPLGLLHGFTGAGANWDLVFKKPPPRSDRTPSSKSQS